LTFIILIFTVNAFLAFINIFLRLTRLCRGLMRGSVMYCTLCISSIGLAFSVYTGIRPRRHVGGTPNVGRYELK